MLTKRVISLFTFGILLLVIGAISKFFNYAQSNLLMAVGLVFELLAALLFIVNKLRNK